MYPTFNSGSEELYMLALEMYMTIPQECTAVILGYYRSAAGLLLKEVQGGGVQFQAAVKALRLAISEELLINSVSEKRNNNSGRFEGLHGH